MVRRGWWGAGLVLLVLSASVHAQAAQLEWKLKKGDKFYLSLVSTLKQSMKTLGKDFKQDVEQTTVFAVTVLEVKADKSLELEQKVDSVTVKNLAGGATATDDAFNKQLVGTTFKITLSPKGEITKFEGYDDLVKKIAGDDKKIEEVVKATLSEEDLKRGVGELFDFLPGKPVKVDEKWPRQTTLKLGGLGSFVIAKDFTYEGTDKVDDKNLDKISFLATVKYEMPKGASGGLPFQVVKGDLTSDEYKGVLFFDGAAGRLVSAESNLKLRGSVTIQVGNNTNIDTDVVQEQTVRLRLSDKPPAPAK